jgi:hypothetical protein
MQFRRSDESIKTIVDEVSNSNKSLFNLLTSGSCQITDLVVRDDFFSIFVATTQFQFRDVSFKVLDWFATVENYSKFLMENKQLDRKVDYYLRGLNLDDKPFHDRNGSEYRAVVSAIKIRNPFDNAESISLKAEKFKDVIISKLTVIKNRTNKIATKLLNQILEYLKLDTNQKSEVDTIFDNCELRIEILLKWFGFITMKFITTINCCYNSKTKNGVSARAPVRSLASARDLLNTEESSELLKTILSVKAIQSFHKFTDFSTEITIFRPVIRAHYIAPSVPLHLSNTEHQPSGFVSMESSDDHFGVVSSHLYLLYMSMNRKFGSYVVGKKRSRNISSSVTHNNQPQREQFGNKNEIFGIFSISSRQSTTTIVPIHRTPLLNNKHVLLLTSCKCNRMLKEHQHQRKSNEETIGASQRKYRTGAILTPDLILKKIINISIAERMS